MLVFGVNNIVHPVEGYKTTVQNNISWQGNPPYKTFGGIKPKQLLLEDTFSKSPIVPAGGGFFTFR